MLPLRQRATPALPAPTTSLRRSDMGKFVVHTFELSVWPGDIKDQIRRISRDLSPGLMLIDDQKIAPLTSGRFKCWLVGFNGFITTERLLEFGAKYSIEPAHPLAILKAAINDLRDLPLRLGADDELWLTTQMPCYYHLNYYHTIAAYWQKNGFYCSRVDGLVIDGGWSRRHWHLFVEEAIPA